MSTLPSTTPTSFPVRRQRLLLLLFCVIAAVRVFIYAAAHPFFGNVDELAHTDVVIKYSQGEATRSIQHFSNETARLATLYLSLEYAFQPEIYERKIVPTPRWTVDHSLIAYDSTQIIAYRNHLSHETPEPPLYYALAGTWLKLGEPLLPAPGIYKLYWARFFNIILAVLLVILAFFCALEVFPQAPHAVIAVTALAAFIPQDTFYTLNNDVMSPVVFGFVFLLLLRFMNKNEFSFRLGFFLGLALAACVYAKLSNVPLVFLSLIVVIVRLYRLNGRSFLKKQIRFLITLSGAFLLPVLALVTANLIATGTITASEEKIQYLGWTYKPFSTWLDHKIFEKIHFFHFWQNLSASFWRGEIVFFSFPLAEEATDSFYRIASALLPVIALFKGKQLAWPALVWFAFVCCILMVIYLVFQSLPFNYNNCPYPSQGYPYFWSGRLISGIYIPFFILFVLGIERLFFWIRVPAIRLSVVIALLTWITYTEVKISKPLFESKYNFFHLITLE